MAPIELHIYGPAFGLPSIDVKCLAAIALLQNYFGPENEGWRLIPSNDPSLNPFNEFPALKDGNLWLAGYRNIVKYIETHRSSLSSTLAFSFDLNETQRADAEAYLSFLESRGLPLLDLSLYVSSDNFTTCTRSALSEIFPWPQSWTIPQKLRDDARRRSEHLGLSGLDVDATREKELKKQNEGLSAQIPKSLRRPKQTVSALLGSTAEQTRFRLEAVTADFFEPLEELLDDKEYLLGDAMTSLDCFALAILAQIRIDGLPQLWLRDALDNRFPALSKWTSKHTARTYGDTSLLPWAPVTQRSWLEVATGVLTFVAESVPVVIVPAAVRTDRDVDSANAKQDTRAEAQARNAVSTFEEKQIFHTKARSHQDTVRVIIAGVLSSAGLVGYLAHKGLLILPNVKKVQPIRRNFGEAGAFLGLR